MGQTLVNVLYAGSQCALVAVALTLTYATSRFMNFMLGAVFSASAYGAYLGAQAGLPIEIAGTLAVVAAVPASLLIEFEVFHNLRMREATPLVAMIASLGVLVMVQAMLAIVFGEEAHVLRANAPKAAREMLGGYLTDQQIAGIISSFLLIGIAWVGVNFARVGREFRAVAADESLARIVGIRVGRIHVLTAVVSSVLAGCAGVVAAYDTQVTPTMGFNPLFTGVVAMLLGRIGDPGSTSLAAYGIATIQGVTVLFLPIQWLDVVVYGILVLVLLIRTTGVYPALARWHGPAGQGRSSQG